MKRRIFDIIVSVLLVVVLSLQIITMVKVFGNNPVDVGDQDEADISTMIQIDSVYCPMRVPGDWMDYMKFEEGAENGNHVVRFGCTLDKGVADLFTIRFVPGEVEGNVGTIVKNKQTVSVVLEMAKIDKSLWSKEELKLIKKMQKDQDEVIKSILEYIELV